MRVEEQVEVPDTIGHVPLAGTVRSTMGLIDSVDLSMVKLKLMDEEEGQGWTAEYADWAECRYRRYLCMLKLNPQGAVVPTKDIDLF